MVPYLTNQEIKKLVINNKKLLIANNMVYDITNYYTQHPGGNCILQKIITLDSRSNRLIVDNCSIDLNFHSKNAKVIWKKLIIGTIQEYSFLQKILMKFNLI
jgi:hypothetical protein